MTAWQRARQILREDLEAAISRDPAARTRIEVALAYPACTRCGHTG